MASEQYQCKAELPIMDTEGAEIEQIALGSYFVDIHDILNREIKEEPIIEYGAVSRECPKNYENGKFYDHNPDSSKFEVMLRDSIEDPTAPAHFLKNGNFSGLADGLAKQEVNHVDDGVILKNEGNGNSLTNNTESKTKTLKDDIDIIYADVKSEICAEEAIGKSENEPNSAAAILIETEIRPNFSHELPEGSETWHQPNIEEDGTTVERNNDTRKKKSFQCLSCSKSFTKKTIFLRHERIHTGEKPYQCKICFKAFTEKYRVRRHERTHTGEKPYQCKICLKCFAEKSKLFLHERVHTGEKPFQCKICLISFTQKGSLTAHERLHTGEIPFQCKICLKSFIQERDLTKHERLHSEERPFQCKICLLSFNQKGDLTKHERLHTGEKPFQCKVCEKKFAQKSTLLNHERIHTEEKPFQCKICLKSFTLKGHLTRHEKIHIGEKQF